MTPQTASQQVATAMLLHPAFRDRPDRRALICAATGLHDRGHDGRCRDCGIPTKGLPVCDGRTFADVAQRSFGEGPC